MNISNQKKIVLVGNPNVGKSTLFNALTGLKQHTGNWAGKTVANVSGTYKYNDTNYIIYDLPGIYSLIPNSEEEILARNFIFSKQYDLIVIICDATCLIRNLNLVLQISEITSNFIVCINLLDEARKNKININLSKLEQILGVPVIGTSTRNKEGLDKLLKIIETYTNKEKDNYHIKVKYNKYIEKSIKLIEKEIDNNIINYVDKRWIAINLLKNDGTFLKKIKKETHINIGTKKLNQKIVEARQILIDNNINIEELEEYLIESINNKSEQIVLEVTNYKDLDYTKKTRKIDKILTNKITGIPIMLLLLSFIFWLTIIGSNYPSKVLSKILFSLENPLYESLNFIKMPNVISNMLVFGIYRVLAWVISVMLPPMAIFFPLFTLLEDLGYLPRIAFNLDSIFEKCSSCGKQALTMCMGFGCNSVGVTGTRIIDSKREKLLAIITNSFIPCNGRFPTIIALITMFLVPFSNSITSSIISVSILMIIILFSIFMTFLISNILSKTILKGVPSSFTLELPPYRKPQIIKVIIRSIFDRTLFILGRAVLVALPAGAIIWIMANININNMTLLKHSANLLNPLASIMGLDGIILLAFILGFPANEIVMPIIMMGYLSNSVLTDYSNILELKKILINNGWSTCTAIATIIFSLIHFPCSTTCLTIKKETKSWKWTLVSIILPTICGFTICCLFKIIVSIFL